MDPLFTPAKLGPYEMPHRILMAPMTRSRASFPGGQPTEINALYYQQRATAALIISEATNISEQARGWPNAPGIYSQSQIQGWKKITEGVHQKNGKIFLQLWHTGRASHPSFQKDRQVPVAPSPIKIKGKTHTYEGKQDYVAPRPLGIEELPEIVHQYKQAAVNARESGFDGVELHSASGYLVDQFLRSGSNHRTDQYGGSIENRVRFSLDVLKIIIEIWGSERVGVRIGPEIDFNDMYDNTPQETFGYYAEQLSHLGIAYLHVVEGTLLGISHPKGFNYQKLRKQFKGSYISNGGFDADSARQSIEQGQCDFVSFGTKFLANPDLPERFRKNSTLNLPNSRTFYKGDETGYTDYPFLSSKSS